MHHRASTENLRFILDSPNPKKILIGGHVHLMEEGSCCTFFLFLRKEVDVALRSQHALRARRANDPF